jgi:hypothetical protein
MGESGNTPQETKIVKAIERSRIAVCFVAMFLGHSDYFRTFAALTVVSLAGLTAVESLLFGDASARIKNWPVGTPYQAQSACNNAALALVTLALLAMPETERTDAALATTTACTLLFILLSGVNHLSHAQDASIHKKRFYGAASLCVSGGVVLYKWGAF